MKEELISFEQAKGLKRLGFPQKVFCNFYVCEDTKILYNWLDGDYDMPSGFYGTREPNQDEIGGLVMNCKSFTNKQFDYNNPNSFYDPEYHTNQYHNVAVCPTQSLAQKWLRDEKNIYIVLIPCVKDIMGDLSKCDYYEYRVCYNGSERYSGINDTYEGALSDSIDHCIEFLEVEDFISSID